MKLMEHDMHIKNDVESMVTTPCTQQLLLLLNSYVNGDSDTPNALPNVA